MEFGWKQVPAGVTRKGIFLSPSLPCLLLAVMGWAALHLHVLLNCHLCLGGSQPWFGSTANSEQNQHLLNLRVSGILCKGSKSCRTYVLGFHSLLDFGQYYSHLCLCAATRSSSSVCIKTASHLKESMWLHWKFHAQILMLYIYRSFFPFNVMLRSFTDQDISIFGWMRSLFVLPCHSLHKIVVDHTTNDFSI